MDISAKRLLASVVAGVMIASALAGFWVGGIALAQPEPLICPLDEDFSGSWMPTGWTQEEAGEWLQGANGWAGGTAPEAVLFFYAIIGDYAYLDSEPVDTSSATILNLEFKSFISDYCCGYGEEDPYCDGACGSYDCRVYTRADAGDSWTDVTPWNNPIYGNVGPGTHSIDIGSDIGSATQVRFEFYGYNFAIDGWLVDDVKICGAGLERPDLVVEKSVTFDDYGNFIVSFNLTNQGTAPAGISFMGKYVDGVWQDSQSCPSLGPGESHNGTFSSQPCSDFASCGGTFNVTVCADDDGDVDESDEYNNCEVNYVERPCPDLVVSKSVVFDEYGNFIVSFNLTNVGSVEAGPSTTAKYVNGGWEDSESCPPLGPGDSHNGTFSSQPCSDFAACGGTFNVTVCADNSGDVDESDEYNNCSEINTVTRPCPDLVVSKSVTLDEYGNFVVSYNISNVGTIWAAISLTAMYVDGVWLDGQGCPSLGPGDSHNGTFSSQPCSDFASCGGTFNVTVCADDDGEVQESLENNNCESNNVTRPCPDLVVSASVALDEYGDFTISYNVTNQGTIWADSSQTAKYVDGGRLDGQGCPSLGPGGTYSQAFDPEFCSDFASCGGTFNVTVCADDLDEVQESDEYNNCDVNIVERPCTDLVVSKSVTLDEYGNFIVSYNISNVGTTWAGTSLTAKYVNGVWQDDESCPPLGPGDSHSGTFLSEPIPSPCPCGGTFNVTVCADDWVGVEESLEDNNCETNVVECPCPKIVDPKQDSLYLDVDADGAASSGDILQYIAEIRNEGNAAATGVTFNDTVDVNTTLLCAAPYAPIASQGSISSCNSAPGGSLAADLGDIGPGGVATVTFYVRIGYGDFDHVYNQGVVGGDNFADDPTDDPDTAKPDDPTDTLISLPGPTPPPGVPTINHWGIVAMITLFAALLVWRMRRRPSAS